MGKNCFVCSLCICISVFFFFLDFFFLFFHIAEFIVHFLAPLSHVFLFGHAFFLLSFVSYFIFLLMFFSFLHFLLSLALFLSLTFHSQLPSLHSFTFSYTLSVGTLTFRSVGSIQPLQQFQAKKNTLQPNPSKINKPFRWYFEWIQMIHLKNICPTLL